MFNPHFKTYKLLRSPFACLPPPLPNPYRLLSPRPRQRSRFLLHSLQAPSSIPYPPSPLHPLNLLLLLAQPPSDTRSASTASTSFFYLALSQPLSGTSTTIWHFHNITLHSQGYFVKLSILHSQNGFTSDYWATSLHQNDFNHLHNRYGTLQHGMACNSIPTLGFENLLTCKPRS